MTTQVTITTSATSHPITVQEGTAPARVLNNGKTATFTIQGDQTLSVQELAGGITDDAPEPAAAIDPRDVPADATATAGTHPAAVASATSDAAAVSVAATDKANVDAAPQNVAKNSR